MTQVIAFPSKKSLFSTSQSRNKSVLMKAESIASFVPLIRFLAQKVIKRCPPQIELEDLIQVGFLGLYDAIDKFDTTKDNQFKTYAEFRIKGAMLDEIRKQDWIPRSVRDTAKVIDLKKRELEIKLNRAPESKELAQAFKIGVEEMHAKLNYSKPVYTCSWEEMMSPQQSEESCTPKSSLKVIVELCKGKMGEDKIGADRGKNRFQEVLNKLPSRQARLLTLYYFEGKNLREIASELQITESRVSQLHTKTLAELKNIINDDFPQDEREEILAAA